MKDLIDFNRLTKYVSLNIKTIISKIYDKINYFLFGNNKNVTYRHW